ncbi:MAG TPA: carbohydrate-binding protein [Candidatus Dormibacteraeota bacterium]|nr:carbohydrate-binding protein [Candidatus Dormibacteraeota bacterium]
MTTRCFISGVLLIAALCRAELPADYHGKPFVDPQHQTGPAAIPGTLQCASFDLGGEGIAYHSDGTNHGSGELNLRPDHHRPHATPYIWSFRADENVSISYTKDFADFSGKATVLFAPATNQLYVGWTQDGQWLNYTVNVKTEGTYKIIAIYAGDPTTFRFLINHRPAAECKIPVKTGSMHRWNRGQVGTISFQQTGAQLLTFQYNKGNNFALFDFELQRPVE